MYWPNTSSSLAFTDPVIRVHLCPSFQTACLKGAWLVPLLLMKALRARWSESCRDPSGTLSLYLWIFCSSLVSLHLQAWTSDVAVVLMRTASNLIGRISSHSIIKWSFWILFCKDCGCLKKPVQYCRSLAVTLLDDNPRAVVDREKCSCDHSHDFNH